MTVASARMSINEPTAQQIAAVLGEGKEKRGSTGAWYSKCPAHQDASKYSLVLRDGQYGVQMSCVAGCPGSHVRAYIYRALANKAAEVSERRKVVSIERKERISKSLSEIRFHISEIVDICADWLAWKIEELGI